MLTCSLDAAIDARKKDGAAEFCLLGSFFPATGCTFDDNFVFTDFFLKETSSASTAIFSRVLPEGEES